MRRLRSFCAWLGRSGSRLAAALALVACAELKPNDRLDAGEPSCHSHADCTLFAEDPQLCLASRCVRLRNDDPVNPARGGVCKRVLGGESLLKGAEPFVFGVLTRLYDASQTPVAAVRNYDLAIREFASKGGVPIAGTTRVPVTVLCDGESADRESLRQTLHHLTAVLDVPAVLSGIRASEDLTWAFDLVHRTWGKNVLFLSPYAADDALLVHDDHGLLWHLLGRPADLAPVYGPLVARVEAYLRGTTGLSAIRLALVDSETGFASDLGNLVDEQLRSSDSSPDQNGAASYLRVRIPSDASSDRILREFLPKLVEFSPDVVVFTGAYEAILTMELLGRAGATPSFYVLSHHQLGRREDLMKVLRDRNLFDQVAGVSFAGALDEAPYQEYRSILEATFPNDTHLDGSENHYDAAYSLIYSAVAADSERPLDGAQMALGLQRLIDGPPHTIGGRNIPSTTMALRTEPSITFQGTRGRAAFDPETGAFRGNGSVFCIDMVWLLEEKVLRDVLRYDRETGELDGSFPCVEGF